MSHFLHCWAFLSKFWHRFEHQATPSPTTSSSQKQMKNCWAAGVKSYSSNNPGQTGTRSCVSESRVSLWDASRIFCVWCSMCLSNALTGASEKRFLWPPGTQSCSTHTYRQGIFLINVHVPTCGILNTPSKRFLKGVRHQWEILKGFAEFQMPRSSHLSSTKQKKEQNSTYCTHRL